MSGIEIVDISNSNCWYQKYESSIPRMCAHSCINNWNYWYQGFEFLISTIPIPDIKNVPSQQFQLLISLTNVYSISYTTKRSRVLHTLL